MVETIMRSQAALDTLSFIDEERGGLLKEWLNQMLFPQNPMERAPSVHVSVNIQTEQATTWAGNVNTILQDQLAAFYKASGFKDIEAKLIHKVLQEVPEGALKAWLRLGTNDLQETGWAVDGVFPLKLALGLVPKGVVRDRLTQWYAQFEVDACLRVGRSVIANRYTILHTELFGDNIVEDLELYMGINQALELSPIPEVLLDLIEAENPPYLELSFWIGSQGVLQLGLVVPNPSAELVQRLSLIYNESGSENLAAFEGALGTERPNALLIGRRASGIVAELLYE